MSEFGPLAELLEEPPGDLDHFERRCMEELMALGRAMMAQRMAAMAPPALAFEEQGQRWSVAVTSPLSVMTTFGTIKVERPLFRAVRNGPTRCVLSERAGVIAGFWTASAAQLAALAVSEMPLEHAEDFFARAGIVPASKSSLMRLVDALSELWEQDRESHEEALRETTPIPEHAASVAISLDGVMVRMTDSESGSKKAANRAQGKADTGPSGWREASVGVASFYDIEGARIATHRYARMPETDKVATKQWLSQELSHIRKVRPDLVVMAIADGAANNWSFLEALNTDVEVVDFYHTAEHLHRHVSKANGAFSLDTQDKLQQMRRTLLDVPGGAHKVFEDMNAMREAAGTQLPSVNKTKGKRCPTYFERHHGRMPYAELRALNLPIGSGVTESTCKLAVCDRLRRTGMRWSQNGGQAVMTLRAHRISGRFDPAWKILMTTNAERLAA